METPEIGKGQSAVAARGGNPASNGASVADLLSSAENGVYITGLVLVVEEPRNVAGTSGKGKAYDFWTLGLQIFTGTKAVACQFRGKGPQGFPVVKIGTKDSFKVENGRLRDGAMTFDLINPVAS
jgi:hypothetical protein